VQVQPLCGIVLDMATALRWGYHRSVTVDPMVAREVTGNNRRPKGPSRIERSPSEIVPKEQNSEKAKPDSKRGNKGRTMLLASQFPLHKNLGRQFGVRDHTFSTAS